MYHVYYYVYYVLCILLCIVYTYCTNNNNTIQVCAIFRYACTFIITNQYRVRYKENYCHKVFEHFKICVIL